MKHIVTHSLTLVLTGALVSACTLSRENAADAFASAACKQERRCDRGSYDVRYDSASECREEFSDVYEGAMDLVEAFGCDYDAREAHRVLGDLKSASCEEYERGVDTDELYVCGS